jgi:outer membrane protein OmpA-like peptidoglycan-associated protein
VRTSPAETPGARTGKMILATAAAALFVGVGAWWAAGHVQGELTRRSRAALAAAGIPVNVQYDGFDAVLSGSVADSGQAADAIGIVGHVPGTRHVDLRAADPVAASPAGSPRGTTSPSADTTGPGATSPGGSPTPGTTASSGVRLPRGSIHFANGDATLAPRYQAYLDRVAAVLLRNPHVRLLVRGHSDDIGPDEVNWTLSEQRAQVVVRYLQGRQVPRDRLRLRAMAATSPVAANDTPEGRAANRRVELVIEEV